MIILDTEVIALEWCLPWGDVQLYRGVFTLKRSLAQKGDHLREVSSLGGVYLTEMCVLKR